MCVLWKLRRTFSKENKKKEKKIHSHQKDIFFSFAFKKQHKFGVYVVYLSDEKSVLYIGVCKRLYSVELCAVFPCVDFNAWGANT